MYEVKTFTYDVDGLQELKLWRFGDDWPVVYILEDGEEAYVGETINSFTRAKQHLSVEEREKLDHMHVVGDDEYNKSATLDTESLLIQYMSGDGKFLLQNGNLGIRNSNYYDRERYRAKFQTIWEELRSLGLAHQTLEQVENSNLFKYSPYKALSQDQLYIVNQLLESMEKKVASSHLVSGEPGTGKTIVATYLMKALKESEWAQDSKIGLVVPMTSLRKTLKNVFSGVMSLRPNMVLSPHDVVKDKYDILIVDEVHRLQRRKIIVNYRAFDRVNELLGLDKYKGTQLDWIMRSSDHQVLLYDGQQSIKPADVRQDSFDDYDFTHHRLSSQMRVKGGSDYISYIENILNVSQERPQNIEDYEVCLVEDIRDLVDVVRQKDEECGLSRLVAGYSWKWETRDNEAIDYDIEIDGVQLRWNSATEDWVNSEGAVDEVGCIHTIQGYDLNYAGVIIGREISFDKKKQKIVVDKSKYLDFNGKRAISDPKELEDYIKNIYKVLLTRAIHGTYIYVVNDSLREYMKKYFDCLSKKTFTTGD